MFVVVSILIGSSLVVRVREMLMGAAFGRNSWSKIAKRKGSHVVWLFRVEAKSQGRKRGNQCESPCLRFPTGLSTRITRSLVPQHPQRSLLPISRKTHHEMSLDPLNTMDYASATQDSTGLFLCARRGGGIPLPQGTEQNSSSAARGLT